MVNANVRPQSLSGGNMAVMRVDLVSATGPNVMFHLAWHGGVGTVGTYVAVVGSDYVGLIKAIMGGHSFFSPERPKIPLTNVVLSLALHSKGDNVFLTTQIQDKGPGQAVLYQKTVVDTPASDPCLSGRIEFEQGAFMTSVAEPGQPWASFFRPYFGLWQATDGKMPAVQAVFDNFVISKPSLPSLSIQPAMAITWPSTAFPFQLETTSLIDGANTNWRPVLEPQIEWNGMKQVTIPVSYAPMGFFRLK